MFERFDCLAMEYRIAVDGTREDRTRGAVASTISRLGVLGLLSPLMFTSFFGSVYLLNVDVNTFQPARMKCCLFFLYVFKSRINWNPVMAKTRTT